MPSDLSLFGLLQGTLTAPRLTAERLLRLGLTQRTLIEATALLAALGSLGAGLTGGMVFPDPQGGPDLRVGPIVWAVTLGAITLLSASALQAAGRVFGGRGEFGDALLVTVWLNFTGLSVLAVVMLLSLLSAQIAAIALLVALFMLLWALINFVRIVHGFAGYGRAIATMIVANVLTFVGISFIVAIAISVGGTANV